MAKLTAVLNDESGETFGKFCGFSGGCNACVRCKPVHGQKAEEVEQQHRAGVHLPIHLLLGPHAGQAIEQTLERAEHAVQAARLTVEHAGHVPAQRLGQRHEHDQEHGELQQRVGRHENHSGFKSAIVR